MNDLKRLLNKLAKEQNFTTAQGIIPYTPSTIGYDCTASIIEKILNLISRTPAPSVNPLVPIPSPINIPAGCQGIWTEITTSGGGFMAAFTVVSNRSGELSDSLETFCDGSNPSGLGQMVNLLRDILCALAYVERGLGFIFPSWSPLGSLYNAVSTLIDFSNSTSKGPPTQEDLSIFCHNFNAYLILFFMFGAEDWMDHLDLSPLIQIQPVPITCYVSVEDQILLGIAEVVDPATLNTIAGIMMILGQTIAVALMLAVAWPLIFGGATYAAAVLAARAVATAALAVLVVGGFITQAQADGLVDDMVDGVEACEDPASIEAEEVEIEKGEGCCMNGQFDPNYGTSQACFENGGTWGNLEQLGCLTVPDGEK